MSRPTAANSWYDNLQAAYGPNALCPSGDITGATDYANFTTAIAAHTLAGTEMVVDEGVYYTNGEVQFTCSASSTMTAEIKAAAGYTGVVASTPLGTQVDHVVITGFIFDSNNTASIAFWAHQATHSTWQNTVFRNSTVADMRVGDPADTGYSYGNKIEEPQFDRTVGGKASGGCNLHMTGYSTDCTVTLARGNGQECGIWNDGGNDNKFYTGHMSNQPTVAFLDTGVNCEWIGCIPDTVQPLTHAGANALISVTTINDPLIAATHVGLPVTGVGIPGSITAPSFVGAVNVAAGTFALVNASGGAATTTAAVSGIVLAGVGINLQTATATVIGGSALMATAIGTDNACFGICAGPTTNLSLVTNFKMNAQNTSVKWAAPLVGKTGFLNWIVLANDGTSCHSTYPITQFNSSTITGSFIGATNAVYSPSDDGNCASVGDPAGFGGTSTALVSGTPYLARLRCTTAHTPTKFIFGVKSLGSSTMTTAECFVGVFNSSGTLIGVSADVSASIAAGQLSLTIGAASGQSLGLVFGSIYYAAILLNWTSGTGPTLVSASNTTTPNAGGAAPVRFGSFTGGQASMPLSETLSGEAGAGGFAFWAALQ